MNHDSLHASHLENASGVEMDLERQAYLEELQIDSLQFGVGRVAEPAAEALG